MWSPNVASDHSHPAHQKTNAAVPDQDNDITRTYQQRYVTRPDCSWRTAVACRCTNAAVSKTCSPLSPSVSASLDRPMTSFFTSYRCNSSKCRRTTCSKKCGLLPEQRSEMTNWGSASKLRSSSSAVVSNRRNPLVIRKFVSLVLYCLMTVFGCIHSATSQPPPPPTFSGE